jgi:hypothetical protein
VRPVERLTPARKAETELKAPVSLYSGVRYRLRGLTENRIKCVVGKTAELDRSDHASQS